MKKGSLDKRTKWCYCIGATGRDAAYALVSMYLLTYVQYTMKLTVAQFGVISAAIVICLIWDAINDALMGIIIENTHFKSGKFKPWILAGAVLNALVIIALFTLRPQGWGFVAFFSIGYLLWGMTYTMNDIAYWGMLPSLSSDPKERDTLVTLMSVFICIGQFTIAGIVPTVIAGNAIQAYRVTALIVALAFIAFQTLVVVGVREAPRRDDAEKVTLGKMFSIFMRNDQLVPIGFVIFFFQGLYNLAVIVMLNNTIEYDELRFGERHDSVISAIRSFSVKLAGAVNQGISALVLILSGIYTVSQNISGLEIEVGKGTMTSAQALEKANAFAAQVQPRQTLLLRIGMVAVPILTLAAAYILIRKKYKITEEVYQKIVTEIAAR